MGRYVRILPRGVGILNAQRTALLVALTAIGSIVSPCASGATVAFTQLNVVIDNRYAGAVEARREGASVAIPLLMVARALGWTLDRAGGAWRLRGEGHAFIVRAGVASVLEGGSAAVVLHRAPIERAGRLYVWSDDLAALFDIRASIVRRELRVSTTTMLDSGVTVTEQPKPRKKVVAVATPAPTAAPVSPPFQGNDRVALTLVQRGGARSFDLSLATIGMIRSGIMMSDDGIPITGSMTFGSFERNLTIGAASDPLTGTVVRDSALVGGEVRSGRYDLSFGRRQRDGRTVAAVAASTEHRTDFAEVLRRPGGRFDQIVLGRRLLQDASWGQVGEELSVSSKGIAAGFDARSRGRLYGEVEASAALGGFPIEPGDAPLGADVAYDMSRAFTARAGVSSGRGLPASPFASFHLHERRLGGTFTVAKHILALSGSYASPGATTQVAFSRSPFADAFTLQSTATVRSTVFELGASGQVGGGADITFVARRPRHGFDLLAGVELDTQNAQRSMFPIVGISTPLVRGLDLETTVAPVGGKATIKVSLVAGFAPPHRAPRPLTVPLLVRIEDTAPEDVALFVDGLRIAGVQGARARIDVSPGRHYVRVESLDGARGSQDQLIDTSAVHEVALQIWPIRAIAGRIVIDAPASLIPRDFSFAGMTVVLEPSGAVAAADDAGRFAFPPMAVAPDAVVRVDEETLPAALASLGPISAPADDDVAIRLGPSRRIEKTIFRNN